MRCVQRCATRYHDQQDSSVGRECQQVIATNRQLFTATHLTIGSDNGGYPVQNAPRN